MLLCCQIRTTTYSTSPWTLGGPSSKLVYFSRGPEYSPRSLSLRHHSGCPSGPVISHSQSLVAAAATTPPTPAAPAGPSRAAPQLSLTGGGRLHFNKFETAKIHDCINFIKSKRLHCYSAIGMGSDEESLWGYGEGKSHLATVKATGGGAFKYAEEFREKLGVTLQKEDEMACLVAGVNFLIRTVRDEAFTHVEGQKKFPVFTQGVFPYLLVNIGSGVSILKVDGPRKYQRVSGTNLGGGTFWGLGRLLTGCKSFDDILEISQHGDNAHVDMLVGDIYGGLDYSKIGLSASTIASSFGRVVGESKELQEYKREDIALSLLRMISYNIGQIAYLNALRYGLKRIFFGGFFIRNHSYTMDTISFAIKFWSKGEMEAMFLRHEGYLGALGAFLSSEGAAGGPGQEGALASLTPAQLVERFPVGAPFCRGHIKGPLISGVSGKVSWVEKFMHVGQDITAPVPMGRPGGPPPPATASLATAPAVPAAGSGGGRRVASTTGLGGFERPTAMLEEGEAQQLHSDEPGLTVGVLHLIPTLESFPLLMDPLRYEPNTLDLNDREEREYWMGLLQNHIQHLVDKAVASEGATEDAQRRGDAFAVAFTTHLERLREEPAAYGKLGLATLFDMREETLREFHFFDAYWAIKQRENEAALAVLPDLLAELDNMPQEARWLALIEGVLAANIFDWGSYACVKLYETGTILDIYRMSRSKMKRPWRVDDFNRFLRRCLSPPPYRQALLFVDNAGADFVLGMLPLARELLRLGTNVVLVANSLPAINDITEAEVYPVLAKASEFCSILSSSARRGPKGALVSYPGAAAGDSGVADGTTDPESTTAVGLKQQASPAHNPGSRQQQQQQEEEEEEDKEKEHKKRTSASVGAAQVDPNTGASAAPEELCSGPVLSVVPSGSGGPCIDLRQVSSDLAAAARLSDLIVLEGMGRCLHTNYLTSFRCDSLKLAMIKNERLAKQLVGGTLYDCVCKFETVRDKVTSEEILPELHLDKRQRTQS